MYEFPRQRFCKWLLLAVLVFSTLDAALFALFDIGMERLGLRCLNSFFEFYLPELFPGKLTVYIAAFAGLAALVGWLLLLCGKRAGINRDLCRFSPSVFQKYSDFSDQRAGAVQRSGFRRAGAGIRKGSRDIRHSRAAHRIDAFLEGPRLLKLRRFITCLKKCIRSRSSL